MLVLEFIGERGKDVEILRKTIVKGGYTGDTITWNTVSVIKGVINNISYSDSVITDKLSLTANHVLYTSITDIKKQDRIKIDGKVYEIVYVADPMNFSKFLKSYLIESDSGGYGS